MNRRILNPMLAFFLAFLFFSSCTKENLEPINEVNTATEEERTNTDTGEESINYCFENPDNPYEYVGVEHNAALDAIAASNNLGNMTMEEAHNIATQSVSANLDAEIGVSYQDLVDAYSLINSAEPILEAAQALVEDGFISSQAFDKIIQLDQLIDDSQDPIEYGNAVIDLENQIMSEGIYTDSELAVLLGGTSIARHSMCYWVNQGMDVTSAWYPYMNLGDNLDDTSINTVQRRGWWSKIKKIFKKVKKFIKSDIAGYKFAKKIVWIFTEDGFEQIVISVIVGVVYSFISIWV